MESIQKTGSVKVREMKIEIGIRQICKKRIDQSIFRDTLTKSDWILELSNFFPGDHSMQNLDSTWLE